jgi:molybdate transport system substrate-binding protein
LTPAAGWLYDGSTKVPAAVIAGAEETPTMRRVGLGAWVALALLAATGCDGPAPLGREGPAAAPAAEPLNVASASDLQLVLPILAERFTRQTRIEVRSTFGASGQLAEQVRAGAPFDVFLAANQKFVQDLAAEGLVRPESVRPYAVGAVVLAVHDASGDVVRELADLARPEVKKIALANPAIAPYGAAGRQALERAGLWAAVEPKIVRAESVRQALQFVESGNAEAGLVGRAVARGAAVRVIEVDPRLHDPIVQALGIVARTRRGEAAEAFARFVLGDEGRSVLIEHGFRIEDR